MAHGFRNSSKIKIVVINLFFLSKNMTIHEQLKEKIDNKTKPKGSLGYLEEIALQIGLIQQTLTPKINDPYVLVFAGDHGLADEGVSLFPKEVTAQMVINFLKGGAAINVFCRQNNLKLLVVDAGVDYTFPSHEMLIQAKINNGTKSILRGEAMTAEECLAAILKGKEIIEKIHAEGSNIVGFGEMGIGNTSSAALIMHKICHFPIDECVGRGTGHNDKGMRKKLEILRKASLKHTKTTTPLSILATFGGFEIAMMVGAMLRAAELGMILLIDGFITTSALLVANAINNEILKNCIFCHQSGEKGHKQMLKYLKAKPLLSLEMRLGEGTGAAIALPIIKGAVNFLNEMASFQEAGVSTNEG
jgi:nicotinate-nucleotide--dimethylbenzimidazole phosphoribosyltransferase